jgi:hypothetical protein
VCFADQLHDPHPHALILLPRKLHLALLKAELCFRVTSCSVKGPEIFITSFHRKFPKVSESPVRQVQIWQKSAEIEHQSYLSAIKNLSQLPGSLATEITSVLLDTAVAMAPTVVHSVTLFDGNATHPNATVVFDSASGKVTSVSTSSTHVQHPSGATVIDGSGHTLLPGLIESHMHCHGLHLPPEASVQDILRSPLKSGVTTVCDMHSPLDEVDTLRKSIADEIAEAKQSGGKVTLSDLKSSLLGATIEGGWPKPIVLSGHPTEDVSVT